MEKLRQFWLILFVLCAGISVSGCGKSIDPTPIIQTNTSKVFIPNSLRDCPEISTAPDPEDPETTQKDVSIYLIDVVGVAEHCKRIIDARNKIIDAHNSSVK